MSNRISSLVLEAQHRIFRLADRDHGLSLKAISIDANIPYNTIRSYADANGTTMMPLDAVLKLVGTIPDYLLSQLFGAVGRALVPADGAVDYDTLAQDCLAYAGEHTQARHPSSPGGVEIVAAEAESLSAKAASLGHSGRRP